LRKIRDVGSTSAINALNGAMLLTDERLVSHEDILRVALMLLSLMPGVFRIKEKT
jgi:hypothetical protein